MLREKRRKEIEEEEKKWVALDGINKPKKSRKKNKPMGKIMSRRFKRKSLKH